MGDEVGEGGREKVDLFLAVRRENDGLSIRGCSLVSCGIDQIVQLIVIGWARSGYG